MIKKIISVSAAILALMTIFLSGCGKNNPDYDELLELYNAAESSASLSYRTELKVVFTNASGSFTSSLIENGSRTAADGKIKFVSEYLINQEGTETEMTIFSDGEYTFFPIGNSKYFKEPVSGTEAVSGIVPPPSVITENNEKTDGENIVYSYITSEENIKNFCLSKLADLYDLKELFGQDFLRESELQDVRVDYSVSGQSIIKCGFDAALKIGETTVSAVYTAECDFKQTPEIVYPVSDPGAVLSFDEYIDTLYTSSINDKWQKADWSLLFNGKLPENFDPAAFDFESYEGSLNWIEFLKDLENTEE